MTGDSSTTGRAQTARSTGAKTTGSRARSDERPPAGGGESSTARTGFSHSYEANALIVIERFGPWVDARPNDVVTVVSSTALGDPERQAMRQSMEALGFGGDRVSFVTLTGDDGRALGPKELWLVVEGLDPLGVVITDEAAVRSYHDAYHEPLKPDNHCFIFGRSIVALSDWSGALASPEAKQQAWHWLKKLPVTL